VVNVQLFDSKTPTDSLQLRATRNAERVDTKLGNIILKCGHGA